MNHGLKAFLLAASTIITCIIVGLGFMMAREAKQLGNHVVEELHQYRIAVEEQDYTKYDGVIVYGNDVVNLMKKEFSDGEGSIRITVERDTYCYTYRNQGDVQKVQDPETIHYIAPVEEFRGEVIRNENDVITELVFMEKK